ncbi:MAG TPA: hypothetical protein ENN57_00750 [Chloroflexi bacterium]|nr:hypothetical protein [Chloroflexota bacterium]
MADFILPEVAAAVGLFSGCLIRALSPFLRKRYREAKEGKDVKWEPRYAWTLVFALIGSFVATMFILPNFDIPSTNIFPIAFVAGWAAQDILNELVE